ncbi:flavodoxin family protein [Pontibacillus halophilus]|uniref:flavodoxin family protein n=1 Tax=Pontibacillus halophilus TaxID=516704 RepID=UPI0004289CAE|nr:flavodoxin family protein [Pontibacillus halophilus]
MSNMKALFLNASLKGSDHQSNTQALAEEVFNHFRELNVEVETIRIADYRLAYGVDYDLGEGDQWPQLFERVKVADIVIVGTPLWLGEKSSVASLLMERLYGSTGVTNEEGQPVYYNKVAGTIITGNEDGAKQAARSILYGMSHIGFTIPPNVDTYWVGEAGPGASFIEAGGRQNEFTTGHAKMLAYNMTHMARILKENPIPADGNV